MRISCGYRVGPTQPTLPEQHSRREPPEQRPVPDRPVGCMRGLGH
jgi:hypothetical protein